MGVVRWQQREEIIASEVSVVPIDTIDTIEEIAVETDFVWPERILQARYWLVGTSPLDAATAYLLAGMMKAIGATQDEVVYSSITDDLRESCGTGLPSWSMVNLQAIPNAVFKQSLEVPNEITLLMLGAITHQWKIAKIFNLPDLAEMIAQPERKRDAWAVLKQLQQTQQ